MCACDHGFLCQRCEDSPADPVDLDAETELEYRPLAADGSADEGPTGLAAWYSARMA